MNWYIKNHSKNDMHGIDSGHCTMIKAGREQSCMPH